MKNLKLKHLSIECILLIQGNDINAFNFIRNQNFERSLKNPFKKANIEQELKALEEEILSFQETEVLENSLFDDSSSDDPDRESKISGLKPHFQQHHHVSPHKNERKGSY